LTRLRSPQIICAFFWRKLYGEIARSADASSVNAAPGAPAVAPYTSM
jgi:hypothetical protein